MGSAVQRRLVLGSRLAGAAILCISLAGAAPVPSVPPVLPIPPIPPGPPVPPEAACNPAPIDDLLVGDAVDLGARGFELRKLGDGFGLESFEVYSDAVCDDQGQPIGESLAATTRWRHGESGAHFNVSQQVAAEPVANVIEPGWATFWWQGYAFRVGVEASCFGPPTGGVGGKTSGRKPGPSSTPYPLPSPCTNPDQELLAPAIAALAPGLDPACFYRREEGSWSDLGSLGLGDPRSALPPSYSESFFYLAYLAAPGPGCAGPAPAEGAGVSFSSGFQALDGRWAGASAYSLVPGSPPAPGYLDEYSATWSDGSYQYSVSASGAGGTGDRDLVRALAAALDPGFSADCLTEVRQLTPGEAVALGFHLAEPPPGFSEVWSQLTAQAASPACADPPPAWYSFYWSFSDGVDLAIEASLSRGGAGGRGVASPPGGGGEPSGLAWTDAQGTSYTVFGYSFSGGPGPVQDLLVAVARSMDPTYDGP